MSNPASIKKKKQSKRPLASPMLLARQKRVQGRVSWRVQVSSSLEEKCQCGTWNCFWMG